MSYNLKLLESFSSNIPNSSLTSEPNLSAISPSTTSELTESLIRANNRSSRSVTYSPADLTNPTQTSAFQDNDLLTQMSVSQEVQEIPHSTFDNYLYATSYPPNGSSNPLSTTSINPIFTNFSVFDASGDNTTTSVFESGALRLSYNLANAVSLSNVRLEVLRSDRVVSTLGSWNQANLSNELINLASFSNFTGGSYQLRAVVRTSNGQEFSSASQAMKVLSWNRTNGTFAGETIDYTAELGTGAVIMGRGGTDTLNLSGISPSHITSINGMSLAAFNPLSGSTTNQAVFGGTAFDYINLADGREIYLQGIERLRFSDSSTFELQVRTNDNFFGSQWNLHISDVGSAWRFTQGTSNVLLASLDTGILTASGAGGGIVDISTNRLITDPSDDDNFNNYGHGHSAISIMSATANNSSGISGINWNSSVYVNDVYRGVSLQQAIRDTVSYARARNQKVVFQGGIQGNWFNSGGTREQLEQLIRDNSDVAIFAIAAGNGGPGGNLSDPSYLTSVSGVAQLETTHNNLISVGALRNTSATTTINGLTNAVSVNIASYSNRGSNLTLMAATDSPAMDKFGNMRFFGGTSGANPNVAGIASLVWSVNSTLTGGQVRQILIDTAMDLGTPGRNNSFGYGLVNADAAVRRASALQRSSDLASLYSGRSIFV
ncbi:S8 family serine peptidase [Gloeocapsopsis crepidinum LEGE 06123]|uniref:S8 family serine peptidase n=1 Tax=Gloeocapsopsis crepidinum LEGE 06123 TaxID=588587 RepID=A0ABR9UPF9_9CHRO|nr:S8 family serine peptidase [Gloeocapsopsis crepidinum]MBE9189935.1 S8 family serine peptidase [Gloeocapsopsis crepidinum LEGE 06123]